jgi:hypothetical protein
LCPVGLCDVLDSDHSEFPALTMNSNERIIMASLRV